MDKQVEVIETNGFIDDGVKRSVGDIFTSARGQYYMDLGWAKCTKTGDVGKRIEGVNKLIPSELVSKAK